MLLEWWIIRRILASYLGKMITDVYSLELRFSGREFSKHPSIDHRFLEDNNWYNNSRPCYTHEMSSSFDWLLSIWLVFFYISGTSVWLRTFEMLFTLLVDLIMDW
jgi:hypothetical protein